MGSLRDIYKPHIAHLIFADSFFRSALLFADSSSRLDPETNAAKERSSDSTAEQSVMQSSRIGAFPTYSGGSTYNVPPWNFQLLSSAPGTEHLLTVVNPPQERNA